MNVRRNTNLEVRITSLEEIEIEYAGMGYEFSAGKEKLGLLAIDVGLVEVRGWCSNRA